MMTNTVVESVSEEGVNLRRGDKKFSVEADSIVVAVGHTPNTEIVDDLKKLGCEVHMCGDINEPRDIRFAIKEGFEVGCKI
jgi:thioredoxin reductase